MNRNGGKEEERRRIGRENEEKIKVGRSEWGRKVGRKEGRKKQSFNWVQASKKRCSNVVLLWE